MSTTLEAIAANASSKSNLINRLVQLKTQHSQVASTLKQLHDGRSALATQLSTAPVAALFTPDEHAVVAAELAALPANTPVAAVAPATPAAS